MVLQNSCSDTTITTTNNLVYCSKGNHIKCSTLSFLSRVCRSFVASFQIYYFSKNVLSILFYVFVFFYAVYWTTSSYSLQFIVSFLFISFVFLSLFFTSSFALFTKMHNVQICCLSFFVSVCECVHEQIMSHHIV